MLNRARNVTNSFAQQVLSKRMTFNGLDRWEIAQPYRYLVWNTIIGWQLIFSQLSTSRQ